MVRVRHYDFSVLNDKEFEILARDLLQAHLNLHLQSFKVGQDKGIDLRHSRTGNDNDIVVQAKHFLNSGYSQLKSILKREELPKVRKLQPRKYMVVTSVPLSPQQKDGIKDVMIPYIKSSSDIFGQEDLNNILSLNPKVERDHYKLWLASSEVIRNVIHNDVFSRSRYYIESIKRKIPLYVQTSKAPDAFQLLSEKKVIVITGAPGVGKTTLANMIALESLTHGYEPVYIDCVEDGERVLDPIEKQLFVFDDFLGSNYLDIRSGKGDSKISRFVDRIQFSPEKRLVMTVRSTILNQALHQYEHLKRSRIKYSQFEICLDDYTNLEKATILYNHLFHRGLSYEQMSAVCENGNYWKIIRHANYNPRLIEFFTDRNQIDGFKKQQYFTFVIQSLDNPSEIWRTAFETQLDEHEQFLLLTLFSFSGKSEESELQKAYEARLAYECKEHGYTRIADTWNRALKTLVGGFVVREVYPNRNEVRFLNPSLKDFFINYISISKEERRKIFSSNIPNPV